jgi:hypothetical protein
MPVGGLALRHEVRIARMLATPGDDVPGCHSNFIRRAGRLLEKFGGANYRTVVRLAEGAGIELTAGKAVRGHPLVSPEKHAEIIAALKGNPNAKQVARKIGGVSHTKVGKIAKAAGITLAAAESGKRLSAEQRVQIIAALKARAMRSTRPTILRN